MGIPFYFFTMATLRQNNSVTFLGECGGMQLVEQFNKYAAST